MCRLLSVRKAKITDELRKEFEDIGEQVLSAAVAVPMDTPTSAYHSIRADHLTEAQDWLREQRDRGDRWHCWQMIVEVAILVAVLAGIVIESPR